MPRPKIAIITGTRAEFGIWTPVLRALQHSKKLRLQLVVTGMHLQKQFGRTIDDIRAAKIPIAAQVPMYDSSARGTVRSPGFSLSSATALARGIASHAAAFRKLKPDLVMVLGDRLEILAAASAALACQIPIAHLHGGETAPGQWDEQIRHAITKMAHLHFCATKLAGRRIAQMGEALNTIHIVGAPALDSAHALVNSEFRNQNSELRIALLLHPSSSSDQLEFHRAALLLRSLQHQQFPFAVIGPNNDPGHQGILRAYRQHKIPVIMSLPQQEFWQRLAASSLLIGNSSAGILEAASFAIPVINLGDRQKGRERNCNVIDVPWPRNAGILPAFSHSLNRTILFALTDQKFRAQIARRQNLYGDGHAARRIVQILESLKFPIPTTKSFHDLP